MNWSNTLSRCFGKVANYPFPRAFQRLLNAGYARAFGIDMSEFDTLDSYPTLNALFTRSLIKNRPFDSAKECLIAPCDSLVMAQGDSVEGRVLQIKGMEYQLSELLGEESGAMSYLNLYLSPRDYHRFHAPCDLEVLECRYFSGELLPVNLPSLKRNECLFVRNERVVLKCRDAWGESFYFIAVGALNVGQMAILFEPRVKSNAKEGNAIYCYETPKRIKKGQEIGLFKMGSTVVLAFQNWALATQEGEKVRYAQTIGTKESE